MRCRATSYRVLAIAALFHPAVDLGAGQLELVVLLASHGDHLPLELPDPAGDLAEEVVEDRTCRVVGAGARVAPVHTLSARIRPFDDLVLAIGLLDPDEDARPPGIVPLTDVSAYRGSLERDALQQAEEAEHNKRAFKIEGEQVQGCVGCGVASHLSDAPEKAA
jgi:hypothetical protein